ncbi:Hsp20/alpha crystallin family protein [Bacillus xiapuensis]|uniref:Hsp20/alpha crystallin family protein n=1 Tax=Bacillus xiapuensis TaxID=2014075 RepID=UPI000C245C45|nr:Hsp20/alpha crystallin family protein [Bacillus xiapuensis]
MFPFKPPFSSNKEWQKWVNQFNDGEIERYVQDVLAKTLPDSLQAHQKHFDFLKNAPFSPAQDQEVIPDNSPPPIHISVFETHEDVYVKIPLQDPAALSSLKIYHTSNQTILEGLPGTEDKKIVILPAVVKKKGATANFKDGILQLKIPKEIDLQYSEIDVSELEE